MQEIKQTKKKRRKRELITEFPERKDPNKREFAPGWKFAVHDAFKDALDIKLTTVVTKKEDGTKKEEKIWTQGAAFSFSEGDVIHKNPDGQLTNNHDNADPHIFIQVNKAAPTVDETLGYVKFQVFTQTNNPFSITNDDVYDCNQREFVRLLKTGVFTPLGSNNDIIIKMGINEIENAIVYYSRNAKKQPFKVTIKKDQDLVYVNCDCPLGLEKKLCRHKINAMRGDRENKSSLTSEETIEQLRKLFCNSSSARNFLEDEWRKLREFSHSFPGNEDEIQNRRKRIGMALANGFENTIEGPHYFNIRSWEENRIPLADNLYAPVLFKYTDSDGETTEREVTVFEIFSNNSNFYLYGYCHLRHGMRTFALNRIDTVYFSSLSLNKDKIDLLNDVKKQIPNIIIG
ncbi:MAG: WYL domain-containing protein [Desulfocapsaceae bacterium]|nr:WYL domain-containing protein [Desulfocapsaceae bacterium]